ncbi:hypothetical protein A0H81_09091 [Grifola frondosa]|uniref:Uncharacterized protein n=1 Tax=Grifola frondosa TaxID=5627 RepID=A0A1C7M126_GRIFR|nr:hypothetical protein A0H81_09091 [Grifola frondosa]
MDFYRQALREALQTRSDANVYRDLEENLAAIGQELRCSELTSEHALRSDVGAWAKFYRLRSDVLLLHGSALVKGIEEAESRLQQHAKRLSDVESTNKEVRATLASLQVEHAESQHVLSEKAALLEVAQAASNDLKKQLEATQTDMQTTVSKVEQSLQKEKEANRRLAGAVQKAKQAEEVFKSEVEQLTLDLAEAERYQEAYISLTEEVDALIARNALAEEEAQRLSKFNAEIIGHNNPAQRIVYVDRIRRELHDAKQKLLMSSRDRDAVLADNDDLRHELELYKSVAVPQEIKPRTMITRVTRVPLAPQSTNAGECTDAGLLHLQTQIAPIAEMSLDEIM